MKKFLSALIVLTMVVAPTGNNICGAEETIYTRRQSISEKQKDEVSKKDSGLVKSLKKVVEEHGAEICQAIVSTVSAGLLTWNGYNLVKNSDKVKEILADTKLSASAKIQAIVKVMFFGLEKSERLAREIKNSEDEMSKLNEELAKLDKDKEESKKIEKECADLESQIKDLKKSNTKESKDKISNLTKTLNDLKKNNTKSKEIEKKCSNLKEKIAKLKSKIKLAEEEQKKMQKPVGETEPHKEEPTTDNHIDKEIEEAEKGRDAAQKAFENAKKDADDVVNRTPDEIRLANEKLKTTEEELVKAEKKLKELLEKKK